MAIKQNIRNNTYTKNHSILLKTIIKIHKSFNKSFYINNIIFYKKHLRIKIAFRTESYFFILTTIKNHLRADNFLIFQSVH